MRSGRRALDIDRVVQGEAEENSEQETAEQYV